ncbi:protein lin-54 homolog [Acanthaster planci]|uniref:Protein lin-54 homolog n=1 Tax=Acanthaster planci TaxID=133434 RepID=A0A8B7Y6I1_ACAPL|nr:protein lin-54 homolog [Acanthaster planci]
MSSPGSQTRSSTAKARLEATRSGKADPVAVIQAELDNLIAMSSSESSSTASSSPSKAAQSTTTIITAVSESTTSNTSTPTEVRVSSGGNPAQVITLPPGSPVGKTIQNIVKRSMPSTTTSQVVTKVIITRNPTTKQPMSTSVGLSTATVTMVTPGTAQTSSGRQLIPPGSPIKLIPIAQPGVVPSQQGVVIPKGVVITSASPMKQNATKVAIPTMKSPTKVTVSTTPKKIAPAPQTIIVKSSAELTSQQVGVSLTSVSGVKTVAMVANPSANQAQQLKPIQIKPAPQAQGKQSTVTSIVTTSKASKPPVAVTTVAAATSTAASAAPATTVQSVQVPGSKFSYVRLVTVTASSSASTQTKPVVTTAKPIAPASTTVHNVVRTIPATNPVKVNVPIAPAQKIQANRSSAAQGGAGSGSATQNRMIMPANTQLKIINPMTGETKFASFPPGTTLLAPSGNIMQNFAMVPMVPQVMSQAKPVSTPNYVSLAPSLSGGVPQAPPPRPRSPPPPSRVINGRRSAQLDPEHRPRKPCNCTKSQCLKLYCDCFANGEFCSSCNCNNCFNNLDHEEDRARAIKACLDRNPNAFKPKIGKGRNGELDRRHNKGCNCKRSGCLKNYCECYEARILCSNNCKCVGCKNFEESPERKTLMHLADAAEVRVQQQTDANTKLQFQDFPSRPAIVNDSGKRLPFSFITNDVAEATCQCLLAQAEQTEQKRTSQAKAERLILEEFGQCLRQVINSAGKTKGIAS